MKRCNVCGEDFPDLFSFCAIDGKPLATLKHPDTREYHPTLLNEKSLAERLATEAHFLFDSFKRAWPQFKADPIVFLRLHFSRFGKQARQLLLRPYLAKSALTAIAIVLAVALSVVFFDHHGRIALSAEADDETLVPTMTIDFRSDQKTESGKGVGAGSNGRVGFNQGRGEGSGPSPARSSGGGGGGEGKTLPSSVGRLPVPSVIPAPIPTTYARVVQSLPAAGINIDPVLWKDLPFRDYGDPRSKSVVPSNGPGNGGGIGTGQGPGIGEGNGPGVGPGSKGNIGGGENSTGCCGQGGSSGGNPNNVDIDRIFKGPEVTTRARVLSKPEPQYTEDARRAGIMGTVILSVVFSRTGQVTNIRAVQTVCCGLTEKAIAAARQIKFVPATRDGRAVSMYMQLEYNFNLY
jgi:TonB family protein